MSKSRINTKPPPLSQIQKLIQQWLEQFEHCVNVRDYDQAELMFNPKVLAFDTRVKFAEGVQNLRCLQWEREWPGIEKFEFERDNAKALVANPFVTCCTVWKSEGKFSTAQGRATLVFAGAPGLVIHNSDVRVDHLVCLHYHFSEVLV